MPATAGQPAPDAADAASGNALISVPYLLGAALTAERLATTLYYTALATPAVLRTPQLGGRSSDPNNPGLPPNGDPQHVRFMQAALDAEAKHAALLTGAGARSPHTRFYFPPTTFQRLGTSVSPSTTLGLIEIVESLLAGLYLAAAGAFAHLGRPDLATLASQLLGIEAEHRTLGRVIAGLHPPNNLTLEPPPPLLEGGTLDLALAPFLTGRRFLFAGDATRAIALPRPVQVTRVVGKYATHRVRRFL